MQNNITKAEGLLDYVSDQNKALLAEEQRTIAGVAVGQAVVAIAKGLSLLGGIAYLIYSETRDEGRTRSASVQKLDDKIQEGLGL